MMSLQKYISLSVVLFIATQSNGQSTLAGIVTGDSSDVPISYCRVDLLQAKDSSKVRESVTNNQGQYRFDSVLNGDYFLMVNHQPFADYISDEVVVGDTQSINIPIQLYKIETELEEVSVNALKSGLAFRDGKIILSTTNYPLVSGSTVIELLKKLPGVVLNAEHHITVNAKSGVRFLLNGIVQEVPEAQMMVLLSSMSAESIASVELIKNPPAKYDAAGTAGLINIVTKQAKVKGYSGSLMTSLGVGKRFGGGANVTLNFKSNQLSVFINTSYLRRNPIADFKMDRTMGGGSFMQSINTTGNDETQLHSFNFNAGFEYDLSPQTLIGVTVRTLPGKTSDYFIVDSKLSNAPIFPYTLTDYTTDNVDRYNSPSLTFYARHSFDTLGTQLVFTADYTNFRYRESRANGNSFYDNNNEKSLPDRNYNNTLDLNFKIFTQKLDFTKSITPTLVFEAGLKSSFVQNNSDAGLKRNYPGTDQFYDDLNFSSIYRYKEQIFAGYLNILKSLGPLSLQGGIRGEQTSVDAINKTDTAHLIRSYFNFFPSLSIGYKQNERNSFQFTYSYRIDRPAYDQLNPIRLFFSELNYGTGNAALVPQYSHNLNLDFNYNNLLISSLGLTKYSNSIYRYTYSDQVSGVQIDTITNLASRTILSYNLTFQKQWSNSFNMQLSGMVAYFLTKGTINDIAIKRQCLISTVSMNNDFLLPKKIRLQLNAQYSSPYSDGIQRYSQRGTVDLALQRKFIADKLNVVLGIYDLFYTDYGNVKSTLPDQTYYEYARNDSRRIRLSMAYTFGTKRILRKLNDSEGEESKRIKKVN